MNKEFYKVFFENLQKYSEKMNENCRFEGMNENCTAGFSISFHQLIKMDTPAIRAEFFKNQKDELCKKIEIRLDNNNVYTDTTHSSKLEIIRKANDFLIKKLHN